MIKRYMVNILKCWMKEEDAIAAVEASFIFPIMLTMFMGVYDAGNAILANQKTIRASQVVADLITRQNVVNQTDVDEAVEAGRLAYEPLDSSSFGIDIVSIRFDDDADTEIVWRETINFPTIPDAAAAVEALQEANEGVLMVSVRYTFDPYFSGFIFNTFEMQEVAFARGRSSPVVAFQ
ncbi:MAG: pilus assembly protein TadG [Alphaproteobacteria bacterium]|nr:pilus assembly protein TadG [Alphaproteobacteria bacterium]